MSTARDLNGHEFTLTAMAIGGAICLACGHEFDAHGPSDLPVLCPSCGRVSGRWRESGLRTSYAARPAPVPRPPAVPPSQYERRAARLSWPRSIGPVVLGVACALGGLYLIALAVLASAGFPQ